MSGSDVRVSNYEMIGMIIILFEIPDKILDTSEYRHERSLLIYKYSQLK